MDFRCSPNNIDPIIRGDSAGNKILAGAYRILAVWNCIPTVSLRLPGRSATPPAIGIVNIVKLDNMIVVMLSLILGSIIGELSALERRAITLIDRLGSLCKEEYRSLFLSLVVMFSMSGTGIFGAMQAGINNDHSILYAKAILDFFTAFSFATSLGLMIASIAIPQMAIQAVLFILAITFLGTLPHHMVANFKATGGLITFAIGLNILKIKELHILNYTPALLLAFPLSYVGTLVV